MQRKHNQAKQHFAYKNDTEDLVALGQFFREAFTGITVKREWFILFDARTGAYVRTQEREPTSRQYKYRHPDLMIFNGKFSKTVTVIMEKPLVCFELDGSIHTAHMSETWERNEQYKLAQIYLAVTNKLEIKHSMFDDAYSKISEILQDKFKLLRK